MEDISGKPCLKKRGKYMNVNDLFVKKGYASYKEY